MKQLFFTVLEITISAGIVILAVKLLSFFINKHYAAKWKKWIWFIIALRLMIPFNISNPEALIEVDLSGSNRHDTSWQVQGSSYNTQSSAETAAGSITRQTSTSNAQPVIDTEDGSGSFLNSLTWTDLLLFIWGAGILVFLLYYLIGYRYYKKQLLRWSRRYKEPEALEQLGELCRLLGVRKQPVMYSCDLAVSPCLMGFYRPVLIMPPGQYTREELDFIFRHELTHYKRYDLWYKLFLLLANAIHWFNPAVYLLRREANIDLEISCDDEVIKGMNLEDKRKYGDMILSGIQRQKVKRAALTTCFNDTDKTLKGRLRNILGTGKKRNGFLILLAILLLLLGLSAAIVFTGGRKEKNDDKLTWYGAEKGISKETELPEKLIHSTEAWNAFLESNETIALVAEIKNEDIYVYGLKQNGEEKGTYHLHGLYIRQGNDIFVLDTDWGVYDELPKLLYQDFDNDGSKEIAAIIKSAGGTGISINDLHIFKKNAKSGFVDYSFTSSDWEDMLNKSSGYQLQDNNLTISIDGKDTGKQIDLGALEKQWGEKFKSVAFGSHGEFVFRNNKIYLNALPMAVVGNWAEGQPLTDNGIMLEVLFDGKKFRLELASQQPDVTQAAQESSEANQETDVISFTELLTHKLGLDLSQDSQIDKSVSGISFIQYQAGKQKDSGVCIQRRYSFNLLTGNLMSDQEMGTKEAQQWIESHAGSKKAEISIIFNDLSESKLYSGHKTLTAVIDYYQADGEKLAVLTITPLLPEGDVQVQYYHLSGENHFNLPAILKVYQTQYENNLSWNAFVKEKGNKKLPAMVDAFIPALWQGDTDRMNQYLLKLETKSQKKTKRAAEYYLEGFTRNKSGSKLSLSYVLYEAEEGNTYLYLDLVKTGTEWKIDSYAMEK